MFALSAILVIVMFTFYPLLSSVLGGRAVAQKVNDPRPTYQEGLKEGYCCQVMTGHRQRVRANVTVCQKNTKHHILPLGKAVHIQIS